MILYLSCIGFVAMVCAFAIPKFINKCLFHPNRNTSSHVHQYEMNIGDINCLFNNRGKDFPIIIYSHGNAGNIYNREIWCNKIKNASVLMYDYKGFGKSKNVNPTTISILQDAEIVYQYVKTNFPNNNIFLLGESMGSAPTWHLASKYNVDGVIVVSGFGALSHVINDVIFCSGSILSWMMHIPDNRKLVKNVSCPILLIISQMIK